MNSLSFTPAEDPQRGAGPIADQTPLFVDLDGTLVRSDLSIESLFVFIKSRPTAFLSVFKWFWRGRAYLKFRVAEEIDINPETLPYHQSLLDLLRAEASSGRTLYLATASTQKIAEKIAAYLGIFHGTLASDAETNLKSHAKLREIRKRFDSGEFDYAGNARADIPIWQHARRAWVVNSGARIEAAVRNITTVHRVLDDRRDRFSAFVKALRLHQWLKNLLLYVPMFAAHDWRADALRDASIGFLAFGLGASAVYLFNDLVDLESDRSHPQKCARPFADGTVPLLNGILLAMILAPSSLLVGSILSRGFVAVLLGYLVLSTAYSVRLKQYVLIDVIVLALLYSLRVIAGAFAIDVVIPFWLLAFSTFLFLSLALVKRCSELVVLKRIGRLRTGGRDYTAADLTHLTIMGTASGYLSVLVFALFIDSRDIALRYAHPQMLWLMCPLLLYWISRLWLKSGRGEINDDPIVFTLFDRRSRYVVAGMIFIALLAV